MEVTDRYPRQIAQSLTRHLTLHTRRPLIPKFAAVFASVVGGLTGKELTPLAAVDALDRMVINLAETSKHPKAVAFIAEEARALAEDPKFQQSPAASVPNGKLVWIRQAQLQQPAEVIAGTLLHEAAHLAGAPGNLLAEFALEAIHNAGYPRR